MWKRQLANVPLPSDPTIRRSFLSPDELLTRPAGDEVLVVGDIFPYCVSPAPHRRCESLAWLWLWSFSTCFGGRAGEHALMGLGEKVWR
jgi:hypothetical protein